MSDQLQELTLEAVRSVAHLARLQLDDAEIVRYSQQLSRILHYVDQLNELDTQDVPPMAHAVATHNVFREDVIVDPLSTEQALRNAPQRGGDYFQVPKVLDLEDA